MCTALLPTTATDLHASCSDFDSIGRTFETLLAYDGNWNDLIHDPTALFQLNEFVYYYASGIDGRNTIKEWLRCNQEKSMLDKFTASDLAFTMLVYENYHPKWVHEITAKREEDTKQGPESDEDNVTPPTRQVQQKAGRKRKNYLGPTLQYTKLQTHKNAYLENGWTPEAFQRLHSLENLFRGLLTHEEAWTTCKESWDSFIRNEKQVEGNGCWVPLFVRISEDDNDDEGDDDAGNEKGLFEFKLG